MRKWMRERMERRKKSADKKSEPSGQVPLQPAYFEAGEPDVAAAEPDPPPADAAQSPEEPVENKTTGSSKAKKRPARRRRRTTKGPQGGVAAESAPAGTPADDDNPALEDPVLQDEPAPEPEPDNVSAQAPTASPALDSKTAKRAPRGVVVLAIGLPGSGKSSWFKRHNIHPLSSDLLRQLLFDDPTEQRYQDLVFSNLRSMLKARLIARRPLNYVDATNLSPHDRHSWIRLAKDYGYEVHGVFFDVPVEICIERNQRRHRQVSDEVMRRMAGKLKPPSFEEGFAKITVVRVKQAAPE